MSTDMASGQRSLSSIRLAGKRHVLVTHGGKGLFQRTVSVHALLADADWMVAYKLPACLYWSAQYKFHQNSVCYTVVLFQKAPVAITLDSEHVHVQTLFLFVTLADIAGLHLLQNITAASFCVFEVNISSPVFLTPSFWCTPKRKVNSTYWPPSRDMWGKPSGVDTGGHTEILIMRLLLSPEEVEAGFF